MNPPTIAVEPPRRSARSASGKIAYLQYLRAVAALSVVLYHASYYLNVTRNNPVPLQILGSFFGNFGVSLFFAISGYLMASLANHAQPFRFLAHRLVRIYPIYWLIAFGDLVLRYVLNYGPVFDPLAFGLIPGGPHYYLLGVEWTLPFELTFYLIIFIVMLVRAQRFLPALAIIWVISNSSALIFAATLQHGQFPTLLYIPFAEKSLAFAAGLLIPFLVRWRLVGVGTSLIGVGLLFGSEAFTQFQPWMVNFGTALLVAWAVLPRSATSHNVHNVGVALGDWSYALYLCHVPIIVWLYQYMPSTTSDKATWLAAVGATLVASVLLGRADMALYGALKRRVDHAPSGFLIALAIVFVGAVIGFGI